MFPSAGSSYLQTKANPCCPSPAFLLHSPGWWNNIHPPQSWACWGCRSEWCTGCWTAGVGGSPWARCRSGWAGNHQQRLAHSWWSWWHWRCACCIWWCRPACPEGRAWSPSQWCLRGEKWKKIIPVVSIRHWLGRICWVMLILQHFCLQGRVSSGSAKPEQFSVENHPCSTAGIPNPPRSLHIPQPGPHLVVTAQIIPISKRDQIWSCKYRIHHSQTCNCLDNHVRDFRDLLTDRNTEHLGSDPVQSPGTGERRVKLLRCVKPAAPRPQGMLCVSETLFQP